MSPTRGVIQEAWNMYRANLVRFMTIAASVWVVVALLDVLFLEIETFAALLLDVVVGLIGLFVLESVLVKTVQDIRDSGSPGLSIGQAFSRATPYFVRMAGAGLLAGSGIGLGFLILIIPGLVLLTWWVLVPAVIVVEDSRVIAAFGRSKELVRGYGWEVFGVIILTYVASIAAAFLLALLLSPLDQTLETFLSEFLGGILINPFVTVTWTLLYFRMVDSKTGAGTAEAPPTV